VISIVQVHYAGISAMAVLQVMVRLAGAAGGQDDRNQGLPVWVRQLRMTDVEVDSRQGPDTRHRL